MCQAVLKLAEDSRRPTTARRGFQGSDIGPRLNLEVEFQSKKNLYFEVLKLFFF